MCAGCTSCEHAGFSFRQQVWTELLGCAGSKVLMVVGALELYGMPRTPATSHVHLGATVNPWDTTVTVDQDVDWKV